MRDAPFVQRQQRLRQLPAERCERVFDADRDVGVPERRGLDGGAMRDAGVEVDDVQWVIGQLDAETPNKPPSPADAFPPDKAEYLARDDYLVDALLEGRIDALTAAFAPDDVFRRGGAIRRAASSSACARC